LEKEVILSEDGISSSKGNQGLFTGKEKRWIKKKRNSQMLMIGDC
jgi:hypothetical protein